MSYLMGLRCVYIRVYAVCFRHVHIYNGSSQATIKHEVNEVERSLFISYIVVSKKRYRYFVMWIQCSHPLYSMSLRRPVNFLSVGTFQRYHPGLPQGRGRWGHGIFPSTWPNLSGWVSVALHVGCGGHYHSYCPWSSHCDTIPIVLN